MPIRYLLFDLDETLYPRNAGVMQQISRQIRRYIVETLGVSAEEADTLARRYHRDYGTSLQGLLANHHIDPDRYLNFVHTLTLDALGPAAEHAGLPLREVVVTIRSAYRAALATPASGGAGGQAGEVAGEEKAVHPSLPS